MSEGPHRTSLYAVKVTMGQEKSVSRMLAERAMVEEIPITAILAPDELRGYIIIESPTPHHVEDLIRGMRHVRSRVQGLVEYSEADRYLQAKPAMEGLAVGTLVEIIAGPFKGMQAKVMNVDEVKQEVIIEILEATFTLPITVHADYVRPIKGVSP
ncbi:MAG: transcription elongation factor Spt5 [Candidatus Bathyarchaeia archaeon]